jgi:glyoxylase I family protein
VSFERIFHVNICVSDLDRAIAFYCGILGMTPVEGHPFEAEGQDLVQGLGMLDHPRVRLRGAFLRWGEDPAATYIDLVQFVEPQPTGQPYAVLNNLGICRTAFKVSGDLDAIYEDLLTKGVEFISPPVTTTLAGKSVKWACFYDQDHTVLEILSDE